MGHDNIIAELSRRAGGCRAGGDGDCDWEDCPQIRDGEPKKTGRDCPLWIDFDDY